MFGPRPIVGLGGLRLIVKNLILQNSPKPSKGTKNAGLCDLEAQSILVQSGSISFFLKQLGLNKPL